MVGKLIHLLEGKYLVSGEKCVTEFLVVRGSDGGKTYTFDRGY
jgi:hypothetical protein